MLNPQRIDKSPTLTPFDVLDCFDEISSFFLFEPFQAKQLFHGQIKQITHFPHQPCTVQRFDNFIAQSIDIETLFGSKIDDGVHYTCLTPHVLTFD